MDVKALDKRLTRHFIAAIINLDTVEYLRSFGSHKRRYFYHN